MYKVTYANGAAQKLTYVSRLVYMDIQHIQLGIAELQTKMAGLSKKYGELASIVKSQKKILSKFGDFFVEGSPLDKARYNSGLLILPKHQGGVRKVIIEEI